MTGPMDFSGGGLPGLGAAAGAFSGLSRGIDTLLQLRQIANQMKFQKDQATRAALMQHGIFLPDDQDPGQAMSAPPAPEAQLPAPAKLQGMPGFDPGQQQAPIAPAGIPSLPPDVGGQDVTLPKLADTSGVLHSPVSDIAMQTRFLQGTPNLGQQIAGAHFQLDPNKPGYGSAASLPGGGFMLPPSSLVGPEAAYARALLETQSRKDIAMQPYTQGPTPEQQATNELKRQLQEQQHELAQARLDFAAAISNRNFGLRDTTAEDRRYNKVIDDYRKDMDAPNKAMAAYQRVLGELNSGSALNGKTATGALSQLAVPENAKEASQINATLNAMSGKLFGGPFTTWENFQAMLDKVITLHGSTLPDDAKVEIKKAADALIVFQRTKRKMAQERANRHAQRKQIRDFQIDDLEGQTEHELWEGNGQQPATSEAAPADPNAPAAPGTVKPPAGVAKPAGKYDDFLGGNNE